MSGNATAPGSLHHTAKMATTNKENVKTSGGGGGTVISDTLSNMTTSRKGGGGKGASVGKQSNSKLYQKYRKLYEHEKKEKDRIVRQLKDDQSELAKLRSQNSTLTD